MYRRSLEPRWREITVSVILIAIALIAFGLLVGRPDHSWQDYSQSSGHEPLRTVYLVLHG